MTKPKSGFEVDPIGYTGFFCSTTNPATGDCFWRCRIIGATDEQFEVELEDGGSGWIRRGDFTPLAMRCGDKA